MINSVRGLGCPVTEPSSGIKIVDLIKPCTVVFLTNGTVIFWRDGSDLDGYR